MESKLARIIKTFTFRLALVYVGVFGLSVIILFGFIYTFATRYLDAQINNSVRMQYNYLISEYRENGSSGVEARIKELIADDEGNEVYLFVNKEYERLSGNLNEWPHHAIVGEPFEKTGNWVKFYIENPREVRKNTEVTAITIPLSKWRLLLVGQTRQNSENIEQIIVQTFWASLFVTIIMALVGAVIMTRSVMQRLGVINRSAATIMHGEMNTRIPFTKGGDEFDELSSSLNEMLDKIETLLQSLSQFANNIAHDLRSPLNRIINRLDAGLRNIGEENPARALLEKNIHDMQGLVDTFNSILKISELESGADAREFAPCNPTQIIEDLVEFYEPYAAEKNICLENLIPSPLEGERELIIEGEKNLLSQAFANLLDNAVKFSPEGGRITLSCEKTAQHIDILIADNGPGIPADLRDKVFEKFFRLEQSRNTKGNGLGLSLVEAVARIHGVMIMLEDNQPGLRVRLRFTI